MPPRTRSPIPVPGIRHGTSSGYTYYNCGCDDCLAWNRAAGERVRERARQARARGESLPPGVKHGTSTAYNTYGCRCPKDRKAATKRMRLYRLRKSEQGTQQAGTL